MLHGPGEFGMLPRMFLQRDSLKSGINGLANGAGSRCWAVRVSEHAPTAQVEEIHGAYEANVPGNLSRPLASGVDG